MVTYETHLQGFSTTLFILVYGSVELAGVGNWPVFVGHNGLLSAFGE